MGGGRVLFFSASNVHLRKKNPGRIEQNIQCKQIPHTFNTEIVTMWLTQFNFIFKVYVHRLVSDSFFGTNHKISGRKLEISETFMMFGHMLQQCPGPRGMAQQFRVYFSSRRPKFGPQHPHGVAYNCRRLRLQIRHRLLTSAGKVLTCINPSTYT